jgi:D-threo-aldose 1-dehydrogenase
MDGIKVRKLGRTGLSVTDMGFGASPIGNFLRAISDETANAMILRAWETGMRLFDTAPLYGNGLSELRLGYSLRWRPRDDFILSSKVGRLLTPASRQSVDFRPWVDGAASMSHSIIPTTVPGAP